MSDGKKRRQVQRLLDGELSGTERAELLKAMSAEPLLQQDYERLAQMIRAVEEAEQPPVPPFFTAEVMRRIPAGHVPLRKRALLFIFKQRTLRWNVAALAVLLLAALSASLFLSGRDAVLIAKNTGKGADSVMTVRFHLRAPDAKSVALAGEFNKWRLNEILLSRSDGGEWSVEVPLPPGTYVYMFVVDGREWVPDPEADAYRDDGFGSKNSVRRVYQL